MTISVTNLTATDFAAKITGITLDDVGLEGIQRRLQHLWLKHQVLVFEGLDYNNEQKLIGLSKIFGRLEIHSRIEYNSPNVPELLYISNMKEGERKVGVLGDGEADWHTDQTYRPTPALGSLLTAAIVPPEGGHTWFADMYRAYDALPESLKRRLEGLKAIQSYEHFNNRYSEPANRKQVVDGTVQVHPVFRVHPITGRKAVYATKSTVPGFVGVSQAEGDELLEALYDHCFQPRFLYEHAWRPGDGVLWDNACVMHKRDTWNPSYPRLMKRTTIRPPEDLAVPY